MRLLTLIALLVPALSSAGIPAPSTSTVPRCIVVCPTGDIAYTVVVRDITGSPVDNSFLSLEFCSCASVHFCPPQPTDGYAISGGCHVNKLTDATGTATFHLRAGGTCTGTVNVVADGVIIAQIPGVQSTDQDGNLMVDIADVLLLAGKMGGGDLTGDLDCSSSVTPDDLQIVTSHLGHSCDNRTPALPSSWGRLKVGYR